jgi:hypothetical protein
MSGLVGICCRESPRFRRAKPVPPMGGQTISPLDSVPEAGARTCLFPRGGSGLRQQAMGGFLQTLPGLFGIGGREEPVWVLRD